MPQVAPFVPLISSGLGALGSWLGGRKGGKAAGQAEQAGYGQALAAGEYGAGRAGELAPDVTNLLDLAKGGYQPAFDYWSRLLSGDRSEMTSVLAPEIGRIGEGYTQARREVGQFAPRGGGRASTLGEIPFQRARDVSTLFSTMRPLAAQSLGQLAGEAGRLGTATGFLEAQFGGMPISAARAVISPAQQGQQNWWQRIMGGGVGGGQIGTLLSSILGAGKKGGGTASGTNFGETGATGGKFGVYP